MTPASPSVSPPRVLISYSHDSEEHKNRVLALSNRLRSEGVNCRIDQYEQSPPEGWPTWCNRQIDLADFVLVACTETYLRRFKKEEDPGRGLGVTFEGHIITQELYDAQGTNKKFFPIVFREEDWNYLPITLKGGARYKIYEDYEHLYRHLTNQPRTPMPELGERKVFAPLEELAAKAPIAKELTKRHGAKELRVDESWIQFYDRSKQIEALEGLMAERPERKLRPVSFLVAGHESEKHGQFHERLARHPLPWLTLQQKLNDSRPLLLRLPSGSSLVRSRIEEVLDVPSAKSVVDKLPPGLTYLRGIMTVGKELGDSQIAVLGELLKLLNDPAVFPDLPPEKGICVGISIQWEGQGKRGPTHQDLVKIFPEEDYPRLRFRVLESLSSPEKEQAEEWVSVLQAVAPGELSSNARDELADRVRRLFGRSGRMTMRELDEKYLTLCP